MPTALIAEAVCRQHDPGWNHPESCERFDAIMRGLREAHLTEMTLPLSARKATEKEILLCHDPAYLLQTRHEIEAGLTQLGTGDTAVCLRSYEVALYAVGSVLRAVDAVMTGEARNAFCVVRPPGHHATRDCGMGFCVFNNVAVAARYAQRIHGAERVLIVDWDVHHGNGTQDLFYNDPSVFYMSTHQSPLYPFTGEPGETGAAAGKGTTLNIPFPAGAGRAELFPAYERDLANAMQLFKPDLIIISAGFDGHASDPIGHFTLLEQDYYDLTLMVMNLAQVYCGNRVVSVLEGGYNPGALSASCVAHVEALLYGCRD
jgi:acetoin utilization deacetylase AcuC-like enzyme